MLVWNIFGERFCHFAHAVDNGICWYETSLVKGSITLFMLLITEDVGNGMEIFGERFCHFVHTVDN